MKRIITLLVEIQDQEKAKWIWDSHINGERNGIIVNGICNGNMFDERDELENKVGTLEDRIDLLQSPSSPRNGW